MALKALKAMLQRITITDDYARECLAELFGTLVLLLFGDGVVAQVMLSHQSAGDYLSISLCTGLGVVFGIHAAGGVSGAHLNPAVTTTLALFGRVPLWKVPGYILAQVTGAFLAGLVILAVYYPLFEAQDPGAEWSMGVFSTFPFDDVPHSSAFLNEIVGTAMLLGMIFALADEYNKPASPYSFPTAVGLLVVGIGMSFGVESGYAINPARDFGPRLASAIYFGTQVFTMKDYYWWVPATAPFIGGPVGAGMYELFIGLHHSKNKENNRQKNDVEEIPEVHV